MEMALYKERKVNPLAPVFFLFADPLLANPEYCFSTLQVIHFVTIEIASMLPFFGTVSRPQRTFDPTSISNFYGALPWWRLRAGSVMAPSFLIGILPLLLGISMWLSAETEPSSTDRRQQNDFCLDAKWFSYSCWPALRSGLWSIGSRTHHHFSPSKYLHHAQPGYKPDLLGNIKGGTWRNAKTASKKVDKNHGEFGATTPYQKHGT